MSEEFCLMSVSFRYKNKCENENKNIILTTTINNEKMKEKSISKAAKQFSITKIIFQF